VARGNEYVDRQAPWKLAKDPASRAELESTLATLMRQLSRQAVYLWPFIPGKAEELWRSLGAPESPNTVGFSRLKKLDPSGWKVVKSPPLFPKKEVEAKGPKTKTPG
jgi:methionyl-tRNA synthetase